VSTFTVPIALGAAEDSPNQSLEAWVDTGSLYSWVPGDVLERLGVRQRDTRQFTLADGRIVEMPIGHVWITIEDRSAPTIVVSGEARSQLLLGAYALEGLSMAADPANERLIPVERINAF